MYVWKPEKSYLVNSYFNALSTMRLMLGLNSMKVACTSTTNKTQRPVNHAADMIAEQYESIVHNCNKHNSKRTDILSTMQLI